MKRRLKDNGSKPPKSIEEEFRERARKQLHSELERLAPGLKPTRPFTIIKAEDIPLDERLRNVMEMELPKSRRTLSAETARIVKCEAFRQMARCCTMLQMADQILAFGEEDKIKRYARYRAAVTHHRPMVQKFLSILKGQS